MILDLKTIINDGKSRFKHKKGAEDISSSMASDSFPPSSIVSIDLNKRRKVF